MAARTSAQAGPWSTAATWTGGNIPGNGDTATISHAVTVTDSRTVGHSPAAGHGTKAILVQSPGSLTITGTGTLICRGDVLLDNAPFTMQAGGIFEFDASAAGTPSTALYVMGAGFPLGASVITITGNSGSRCTVRSNSGGANGRFDPLGNERGSIIADYCDFQRVGNASNPAWTGYIGSGVTLHFGNCTFDANCGSIGAAGGVASHGNSIQELINVTHRGTVSVGLPSDTFTTGTRTISGCCFTGTVTLARVDGFSITNSVFEQALTWTGGPWTTWSGNLVAIPAAVAGDYDANGSVVDTYVLRVGTPTNQHGWSTGSNTGDYTGLIFDGPDITNGNGDCITNNNPSSAKTINVTGCIVLPTDSGVQVGTLITFGGGANLTANVNHNTYNSSGSANGIVVGETYTGRSGMLASAKSNLTWAASNSRVIYGDTPVQDTVLSTAATHNGKWNPNGTGYANLTFSSGSPGANDVSGDPQFVDSTRNIKTWSTSLGGAGTVADALTELRKKNDAAGYNSAYTITALIAYVRAGFVVQNSAFRGTAHDATVIGAIQDAPPSGGGVFGQHYYYTHTGSLNV